LSKDSGFGYEEMMKLPSHIVIGLWNTKRSLMDEENKAQNDAYKDQQSSQQQMPNMSSLMGQAKGMVPPIPNMGGMSMPSMGSFKR
jgi:hypothetical protein